MRMRDLEKEASLNLLGKALAGMGQLPFRAARLGYSAVAPIARPIMKGIGGVMGPTVNTATSRMMKHPVSTGLGIVGAGTIFPALNELTSYRNYQNKMQQPTAFSDPAVFGAPEVARYFDREGFVDPSLTMRKLSSISGFDKKAGVMQALGWGTESFLPRLLAGGLAAGAGGYLVGPTLKTLGENVHNKIYPDAESNKIRMTELAKFDAQQHIKDLERKLREQRNTPVIESVVDRLKKHDPIIGEAARDPALRHVMDQTVHTVSSFSPDLAKDDRAMQSILTEALSSPEGGLGYHTIRSLAETQKFLNQKG